MVKRLAILGSTGSIGRSALEVAASLGPEVEVVALAAGRNGALLAEQAAAWAGRRRPGGRLLVSLGDEGGAAALRDAVAGLPCDVVAGPEGILAAATHADADLVLAAVVGFAGLAPTLAALDAGKDVALANKEALVAGGALVRAAQRRTGARLFPVDSEHAALAQCLEGRANGEVKRLVLTASGGPFRAWPAAEVAAATPAAALAHPVWDMGAKITVDSATLLNKGLEVIEAHWLFDMPYERIDVLIHPQSVVHSLVELTDGSYLAQLATADMRLPIQYALTWPERRALRLAADPLELARIGRLEFEPLDAARFPCFDLAVAAGRAGGVAPAVMSAANEVAVAAFLAERVSFGAIPRIIAATVAAAPPGAGDTYDEVAAADAWARRDAAARAEKEAARGDGNGRT
jgi:1-deoxy-D-xylulose-5-phosphate reductoisomerase